MADVNVSVMIDGKTVFVAGAVGVADANASVQAFLGLGLGHFQTARAAAMPLTNPATGGLAGAKPQDNSL